MAFAVEQFVEAGTEEAKAVAIAGVAIDVAKGLTGALSGWASLGPFGMAGAVASSAAIIATGIKSVRDITSVKKGGSANVSAPTLPNTATVTPPNFEISQTNDNQLADSINNSNNGPIKAYVVGSDVTNRQQMDRIETANATL